LELTKSLEIGLAAGLTIDFRGPLTLLNTKPAHYLADTLKAEVRQEFLDRRRSAEMRASEVSNPSLRVLQRPEHAHDDRIRLTMS
jgi:hypothetical protein